MIRVNPETVYRIVELARGFHAKENVVFPHETEADTDVWATQVLANHTQDAIYEELRTTIESLESGQQANIVALMWLGRGDFHPGEWAEALAQAHERWTPRTAEYLMSTPQVADYLEEGLALFGYSKEKIFSLRRKRQ